jgi:hypothetical protein
MTGMNLTTTEYLTEEAKEMSEKKLQQGVVSLCRGYGVRCYHTHDSRRSEPGFPDCVIAHSSGPIYAELKTEKNRPMPNQVWWLNYFADLGLPTYLWRPRHLVFGWISYVLENGTAKGGDVGRWIAGEGVRGDRWSVAAGNRRHHEQA